VILAAADGGYFPTTWGWAAVGFAWVGAAALLLRQRVSLGPLEVVALAGLAGLSGWTALSLAWSASVPLTMLELERSLVPLTALAAALLLPPAWTVWLPLGVGGAAVAVASWNLAAGGDAPVGYANGVALLCVLGLLLVAGWAAERWDAAALVVALPAGVVLVAALARSDSRAAWLALLGGAAAAAALRLRRPWVALAGVVVVAGIALGVAGLRESEPRAAYWPVAVEAVAREPLVGTGAGTWGRTWLAARDEPFAARDAHSLYLETLAELGPVGLAALLLALGTPLVAAVRVRDHRLVPATAGAYSAFVLHLGVDWAWELTAVAVAGLLLGASLLVEVRRVSPDGTPEARLEVPRAPAVAALAVVAALALCGLAGNALASRASDRLRASSPAAAEQEARRAARLAPWASEPWRLRGEAQLALGRRDDAVASFREGLERDAGDVEIWRALARAAQGDELRRARQRAAQLDPLGAA
jgi:O-antigen ligase